MTTRQMAGEMAAVLLVSSVGLFAQGDAPRDMAPECPAEGGRRGEPCRMMEPRMPGMMHGAAAHHPMERPGEMAGRPPMMPDPERLREAGATEEQIIALDEFLFAQQCQRIDMQAAAGKAELVLHRMMNAPAPDENAVMEAVTELTRVRGELFRMEIWSRLKEKQILGDDLLQRLREQPPRWDNRPDDGAADRPDAPRGSGDKPPLPPQEE